MRRPFYLAIGSLVLCCVLVISEKLSQTEQKTSNVTEAFGYHVTMDLSDPSLRLHTHLPFSNSEKDCETKNSPSSIDLDY